MRHITVANASSTRQIGTPFSYRPTNTPHTAAREEDDRRDIYFCCSRSAQLPYLHNILTQKCLWLPHQCAAGFLTCRPGAVPVSYWRCVSKVSCRSRMTLRTCIFTHFESMLFYSTHVTRHKTGISCPQPENAGVRDSARQERVK